MAVDDAYSRYVMTLKPARYLRFRDLAIGHRAARDEVPNGLNGDIPSKCHYRSTLTASHALSSGVGSLLPAFPGGTRFNPAGGNQCFPISDYAPADGVSSALTSNYYGAKKSSPSIKNCTINLWYRNNVSPGGVNQRVFCIVGGEQMANQGQGFNYWGMLGMFNWNSADNMLVELVFKKASQILGTAFITNIGNNENFRYLSKQGANNTLGSIVMMTLRLTPDTVCMFANGVIQNMFTWDDSAYGLLRPYIQSACIGSGAQNTPSGQMSNYANHDYSTCDISEFSWHDRALTDIEIRELYLLGSTGQFSRKIVGTVTDGVGAPLSGRLLRAHRATGLYAGDVLGEATSAVDGTFNLYVPAAYTGATYVLAFDDLGVAPDYNAAIQHNVIAVSA